MYVFPALRPELIHPLIELRRAHVCRLVSLVAAPGGDVLTDWRPGQPWALDLSDRVPPVAV